MEKAKVFHPHPELLITLQTNTQPEPLPVFCVPPGLGISSAQAPKSARSILGGWIHNLTLGAGAGE